MTKVALLGTGRMGLPMAQRLLDQGHELVVWNRTGQRASGVGARVAASPAEAVAGGDVVITMLSDATAVSAALPALPAGVCLVQMSTIGPDETLALAAQLPPGVLFVDAPVGGSVGAAREGTLRIFAGGSGEALAKAEPVLRSLGTVRHCGAVGAGSALKLVANTGLITALAALHDALEVASAVGVERGTALEVLKQGPLAGAVARAGVTDAEFAIALAVKDARLALRQSPGAVLEGAARVFEAFPHKQADVREIV